MVFQLRRPFIAASIAVMALSTTSIANATTLKADYNFNGNFSSSVGNAPDLVKVHHNNYSRYQHSYLTDNLYQRLLQPNDYFGTATVGGKQTSVFNYDYGTGFQLATEGLIDKDEYSVGMRFKFDLQNSWPTWHRIIDFKNLKTDSGLYNLGSGSNLSIYGAGVSSSGFVDANADGWYDLVITRNSSDKVNIFVDGQNQLSFLDNSGQTEISSDNVLTFFLDNYLEYTAGSVSRIMVFDGELTEGEVGSLDMLSKPAHQDSKSTPEPTSVLAILTSGIAGLLAKRRNE